MANNPFIDLIDQKVAAEQTAGGSSPANPFVPLIDEAEKTKAVQFRAAMHEAKDTDPDVYAKQVDLAKRAGLPIDVVSRNQARVVNEAPFLSGEYEDLIQAYPATARFLSAEDNAKFAKDDIAQLTVMEQLAKMSNPKSLTKDLGRSFMSGLSSVNAGITQIPAFAYTTGAAVYNLAAKPFQAAGLDVKEIGPPPDWLLNNPATEYYKKAAEYYAPEELSQDPIQLVREGNVPQAARAIAAQVVANLPQQVFLVASTLAGQPQVGLGGMGLLSASQATAEGLDKGKSPLMAAYDGITQGSIEAATEQFGTVGIVKHWQTALAKSFGSGTAKQIIADAGKSIAAAFFGEGTEEFAAQIGQDFSDYATGNDKALDGVIQRAMNSFLISGFSGSTITAPTTITAASIKMQRASQDGNFWDRMLGVSAESKLRQRSPEKYEAFVNNLLEENKVEGGERIDGRFFYVSHDALKTFFQTPEGKPDEGAFNKFLDEMEIRDQLADAANAGKEFELSAAKFAAKFAGSDVSIAIRPDIRFTPDGMTQREQATMQQEYAKMVTEMQQQYAELVESEKLPAQVEVMRDKLILPKDKGGLGIKAEDADAQLSVFMAGMNTFAAKAGVPVEEYVRRVNPVLNIGGEAVELTPAVQKPVDPKSTKKAKPIDYKDPKNVAYRDLIAAAGGEFIGTQPGFTKKSTGETTEGLVMFNDPATGTTLALKPSQLTPENIVAKVKTAQKAFEGNNGNFDPNNPNILFQDSPEARQQDELGFFSKLYQVFQEKMPNSAPVEQIEGILAGSGVKQEEMEWMGLKEFLTGKTKVTKEALLEFIDGNRIRLNEVTLGYRPNTEAKRKEAVRDSEELRKKIEKKAEELQRLDFERASEDWGDNYYNDYTPQGSGIEELTIDSEELGLTEAEKDAYTQRVRRADVGQPDFFGEERKPVPAPGWKATFADEDLGVFTTEQEAQDAFDEARQEYDNAQQQSDFEEFDREWHREHDIESYEQAAREELGLDEEGGDGAEREPRFKNYILDNGTNYREVLLTLPDRGMAKGFSVFKLEDGSWGVKFPDGSQLKGWPTEEAAERSQSNQSGNPNFKSSHFDEPNILAHFRLTERDTELGRTLFIEEIQSDWHQQGRSKGYTRNYTREELSVISAQSAGVPTASDDAELFYFVKAPGQVFQIPRKKVGSPEAALEYVLKEKKKTDGVPDAPFKKTWHELASKRILRMAVEEGYDALAWTTGEQQVRRYENSLRDAVDEIQWTKTPQGVQLVGYKRASDFVKNKVVDTVEKESVLSDAIGKSMAQKILGDPAQSGTIEGSDITISDTGMAVFYDQIIPQFLSKYTKKWGGKVGEINIDVRDVSAKVIKQKLGSEEKVHALKITQAMKETVSAEGQPLFQDASRPRGSVQFTDTATLISLYQSANFSTFLHESGHVFMREMEKLVAAGKADPQLLADYNTLKEFVGGDIETVEAQEKLARGFEAYLREGKAPSVKLVDAFRRFRDWLVAIYKSLAGLNVEINDEVRAVFDRILASENEIEEAKQFYRMKKDLVDLIPVTPEEKVKSKKAKQDSQEAALQKAVKERLGIYLRLQGGKQAIREQATKDIDSLPVYKAIKAGIEQNGVDAAVVKSEYGEEVLKTIRTNHPNFAKQKEKAKKGRTYYAEVLAHGGINPGTMGELELKYFKENGLFGLLRKSGGSLDEVAQEMESAGLLRVPDNKNPGDYLKGLLEEKKALPDYDGFVPEEAVTLAEIAAQTDFGSEQELVQAVVKADRRSRAITTRAKELLAAKERDLLTDLKSQERVPGEESLHNDKSLTYLITEAEILADKIAEATKRRPERIEEKLYKNTAEEIIAKKTVRQATRYDLYARAEQRFARQAEDALLNGDFATALTLKKKQMLNHALVQAAIRARDEKRKIDNFFKAKNYKSKLANVENDFAEASIDLTNTFGLGTGQFVLKVTDALQRIRKADEFLYDSIPEWIVNKQIPKNFEDYRDLTMAQLRELNESIRSILAYGNDEMKSIEAGEAKTLQEWVDASVAEMQKLKDQDVSKRDESSKLAKPLEYIDAFASGATLLQFTTDWMDNFSFMKTGNAGPFKRLYNKALDAEVKYNALKTDVIKESKKAWDTLGKAAQRIKDLHGVHIDIPGVPLNEDMRRTKRKFWNVNRMVALLLNTGNAGNLSAIQRSYGYTPQQIQTVASYFTAAELQAIQDIWKATDLLFPQLDETHFAIYNRHLPKVDALPVTYQSMDGKQVKLDGGYYPLVFDHKINDVAAANMEDDLMKNQTQAVIRSTKPTDGFTFSRVAGHSLPPMLETSVWFTHINATSRYISHARILRDLNRLTRDKEWSKEFKKKAGDDHYKNIRAWLQYNANPGRRLLTSKIDLATDWLKSLSTAAVLGFKAVTGLKQRTALINGAQAIGKKKMANGWSWILKAYKEADWRVSVLGLSQSDTWDSITKKSKYLKTRDGNIDREISDLRRGINPLEKKWKIAGRDFTTRDLQDFAFEWIRMNDRATVSIVWTAAYNQYVHELADKKAAPDQVQKAAVAYADGIVQDTQASSLTPELSTIQRQEGWIRLFTSFMTGSMNYGNRIMQNHRAWREGAISNREFFNHVLQENIIFPYTMFLIAQAFRGDDDELAWWEWAIVPFEAAASFIPIVRDLFAIQYGKKIGDSPVFEFPARVGKALVSTGQLVVNDGEFTQAMWDIGRALEVYFKVPALNLVKDAVNMYENLTD